MADETIKSIQDISCVLQSEDTEEPQIVFQIDYTNGEHSTISCNAPKASHGQSAYDYWHDNLATDEQKNMSISQWYHEIVKGQNGLTGANGDSSYISMEKNINSDNSTTYYIKRTVIDSAGTIIIDKEQIDSFTVPDFSMPDIRINTTMAGQQDIQVQMYNGSNNTYIGSFNIPHAKNAYELYVEDGGTLSQKEWLKSMGRGTLFTAFKLQKNSYDSNNIKYDLLYTNGSSEEGYLDENDLYNSQKDDSDAWSNMGSFDVPYTTIEGIEYLQSNALRFRLRDAISPQGVSNTRTIDIPLPSQIGGQSGSQESSITVSGIPEDTLCNIVATNSNNLYSIALRVRERDGETEITMPATTHFYALNTYGLCVDAASRSFENLFTNASSVGVEFSSTSGYRSVAMEDVEGNPYIYNNNNLSLDTHSKSIALTTSKAIFTGSAKSGLIQRSNLRNIGESYTYTLPLIRKFSTEEVNSANLEHNFYSSNFYSGAPFITLEAGQISNTENSFDNPAENSGILNVMGKLRVVNSQSSNILTEITSSGISKIQDIANPNKSFQITSSSSIMSNNFKMVLLGSTSFGNVIGFSSADDYWDSKWNQKITISSSAPSSQLQSGEIWIQYESEQVS